MTLSGTPLQPEACQAEKNSPAISGATNQSRSHGCGISPACNAPSAPRQRSAGRVSDRCFRCSGRSDGDRRNDRCRRGRGDRWRHGRARCHRREQGPRPAPRLPVPSRPACQSARAAAVSDSRVGESGVSMSTRAATAAGTSSAPARTGAAQRAGSSSPPAKRRARRANPSGARSTLQPRRAAGQRAAPAAADRYGPGMSAAAAAPDPGRVARGSTMAGCRSCAPSQRTERRDGADDREREEEPRPETTPFVPVVDRRRSRIAVEQEPGEVGRVLPAPAARQRPSRMRPRRRHARTRWPRPDRRSSPPTARRGRGSSPSPRQAGPVPARPIASSTIVAAGTTSAQRSAVRSRTPRRAAVANRREGEQPDGQRPEQAHRRVGVDAEQQRPGEEPLSPPAPTLIRAGVEHAQQRQSGEEQRRQRNADQGRRAPVEEEDRRRGQQQRGQRGWSGPEEPSPQQPQQRQRTRRPGAPPAPASLPARLPRGPSRSPPAGRRVVPARYRSSARRLGAQISNAGPAGGSQYVAQRQAVYPSQL